MKAITGKLCTWFALIVCAVLVMVSAMLVTPTVSLAIDDADGVNVDAAVPSGDDDTSSIDGISADEGIEGAEGNERISLPVDGKEASNASGSDNASSDTVVDNSRDDSTTVADSAENEKKGDGNTTTPTDDNGSDTASSGDENGVTPGNAVIDETPKPAEGEPLPDVNAQNGEVASDKSAPAQVESEQAVVQGAASATTTANVVKKAKDKEVKAAAETTKPATKTSKTVKAKKASAKKVAKLLKNGWYSIKTMLNKSFYLQVRGSKAKTGTKLVLSKSNTTTGQAFKLEKVSGAYYRILSGTGFKSRIYVGDDGIVSLGPKSGQKTLFRMVVIGDSYMLVNVASGKALAISGSHAAKGVRLVTKTVSAQDASQLFSIVLRKGILKEGIYSVRTVAKGKRALSPKSGKLTEGANAAIHKYNGQMCEKWQVKAVPGKSNTYTFESIATGKRLTAVKGKPAKLKTASSSKKQQWRVYGANGAVILKNPATGRVLELTGGKTKSGALVSCKKKTNAKSQRWNLKKVTPVSNGIYEFDSKANKALALEITGGSTNSNASAQLAKDTNTIKQRWVYDKSTKTLTSVNSGKVLTISGTAASGAMVVQADYNGSANQKWKFKYLGGGKFKIASGANSSLVLSVSGTANGSKAKVSPSSSAATQIWHPVQQKTGITTYVQLGFSLDQMARWQKANNPYISSYTVSYLKSILNPANGSKYKFLDLRKGTNVSASILDKFINTYGSDGKLKGLGYAFVSAAKTCNINEVYLLSHAILESGWGKSELANGYKYSGGYIDGKYYKKGTYYNFFGIGAVDSSPLSGGRKLAIINGWNTPEKAVTGAAKWISGNYIYATNFNEGDRYPQNTLYSMKWDLGRTKAKNGYGWHQYATSLTWADSIGNLMNQAFGLANKSSKMFSYIIPRYK